MQKHERRQLEALLRELINIQRDVARFSNAPQTSLFRMRKRDREVQVRAILAYVEGLTGGPE